MKLLIDKLIQPLMSEKAASRETRFNEYTIVVDQKMTKTEIKLAVETIFGVKPLDVRTVLFRKKARKSRTGVTPARLYKKALIRLPEGKRIEIK